MSKAPTPQTAHAAAGGPTAAGRGALLVSSAGLLAAAYLTYEHFTAAATHACPDSGAINYAKITTSSYSSFLGFLVVLTVLDYFPP